MIDYLWLVFVCLSIFQWILSCVYTYITVAVYLQCIMNNYDISSWFVFDSVLICLCYCSCCRGCLKLVWYVHFYVTLKGYGVSSPAFHGFCGFFHETWSEYGARVVKKHQFCPILSWEESCLRSMTTNWKTLWRYE